MKKKQKEYLATVIRLYPEDIQILNEITRRKIGLVEGPLTRSSIIRESLRCYSKCLHEKNDTHGL